MSRSWHEVPRTQRVLDLASQKGLLRASDLDAIVRLGSF
jgi:hypothetical protein